MKVDYIIRGGRVVDPSAGIDEIRDIYIKNMRIADLKGEAAECNPDCIIDASGKLVTPGLIDFHTHLFHEGSSICIHPDMMIAQGTTSAVDAGSAGTSTYEAFYKSVIAQSQVRIKGFLTVYGGGQLDPKLCEDFNPALYNVEKMERVIEANRDNILGLKIRLSKGVVPDETGADYLRTVVKLADELNAQSWHFPPCLRSYHQFSGYRRRTWQTASVRGIFSATASRVREIRSWQRTEPLIRWY